MRLLNVKFGGNIINGLKLDFELRGDAARFVVLAGENGTGKTTILRAISNFGDKSFLNPVKESTWLLEQRDVDDILSTEVLNSSAQGYTSQNLSAEDFGTRPTLTIKEGRDNLRNTYTVRLPSGKEFLYQYSTADPQYNAIQIFLNNLKFKIWRNNIEPTMPSVSGVSNYDIDDAENKEHHTKIMDLNGEIDIPQLLVDLDNKDAVEFRNDYNSSNSPNRALANRRISRFKDAFNNFFDNHLIFKEVQPDHKIIFSKNGHEFGMDGLSSGEKMIVQCGASLLKDAGASVSTSITMIDEPEQALHPRWQERVLDFYASTVSIQDGVLPQIIVTTHSEHVLKNALQRDDAIIILLSLDVQTNRLKATKMSPNEYILKYKSYDEIKYRAFNILSADYHDDLLGHIQELSGLGCHAQDTALIADMSCPRRHWVGKDRNGSLNPNLDTESLPMYIRHYIHHPELRGTDNTSFSENELRTSVAFLEGFIKVNYP